MIESSRHELTSHQSNIDDHPLRLTRRGRLVLGTGSLFASGLAILGVTKGVQQVVEEFRPGIAVACGDGYVKDGYIDGASAAIGAMEQNRFAVDDNPIYVGQYLDSKNGIAQPGELVRLFVDAEGNLTNEHPVEMKCFTLEKQK